MNKTATLANVSFHSQHGHFARSLGIIFLLLGLSVTLHAQGLADKKIKFSYDNRPLDLVFLDLELGQRLHFEYDKQAVEGIRITQTIPRMPLEEALSYLLRGTGLKYELREPRTIIISEDPNFGKNI